MGGESRLTRQTSDLAPGVDRWPAPSPPLNRPSHQPNPPPLQRRAARSGAAAGRRAARVTINAAVLDELRERGFAALTMDVVAARARTGKAGLYRHRPGKIELIMDVVQSPLSWIDVPEHDGDLRGQLLALLSRVPNDMGGRWRDAVRLLGPDEHQASADDHSGDHSQPSKPPGDAAPASRPPRHAGHHRPAPRKAAQRPPTRSPPSGRAHGELGSARRCLGRGLGRGSVFALARSMNWAHSSRTVAASRRVAGLSCSSRSSSSGVSAPAAVGARMIPVRTTFSRRSELGSVPNGGWPSTAAYSVEPSENTSEAAVASPPAATSGAR